MNRKGITLIELLVALTISGVLVAGVYRTFVSQQHTFTVQDQVVDMQQNVRLAINRMTRELRMAGFGGEGISGMGDAVTPGGGGTSVTVVGAYQAMTPFLSAPTGDSILVKDATGFVTGQYISINGLESHQIASVDIVNNKLTFPDTLKKEHSTGGVETVYLVQAITYSRGQDSEGKWCLMRDNGSGAQPVAENIEDLQFRYILKDDVWDGNKWVPDPRVNVPAAQRGEIRTIQVTLVATTDRPDPDLAKVGDVRTRTLISNIQLRNLGG